MKKGNKILLITASIIMIVVALVIIFTREVPSTTSSANNKDFVAKSVENLRFNDVKIVNNEVSTLVQNTSNSDYSLATVIITVKDASNKVIDELTSYVGESLAPNEIRLLSAKTDRDLSNAKSVDFSLTSYFKKPIRVHTNCDEVPDFTIIKEFNNTLGRFDVPERFGYLVSKLYSDSAMTHEVKSSSIVTRDLDDLYIEWRIDYTADAVENIRFNDGVVNKNGGSNIVTYSGTPVYTDNEVYLNNASLATSGTYSLGDKFTIVVKAKLSFNNSRNYANFIIAMGGGGAYLGARYLGMMYANGWLHASCAVSDSYQISVDASGYNFNDYHTYIIRRNGNNFAFFVDGHKLGENNNGCNIPGTQLIFGGGNNSGTGSAGWSWGYASGYYRNVLVFKKALSDDLISDFEF